MKRLLILVLIFYAFSLQDLKAQETSWGVTLGPNLGYRDLDRKPVGLIEDEKFGLGYTLSAFRRFQGSDKWSFDLGLNYTRTAFRIEEKFELFGDAASWRSSRGVFNSQDSFDSFKTISIFGYLGLLTKLNYESSREGLRVISSFGLTPEVLLVNREKIILYEGDEEFERYDDFYEPGDLNVSGFITLGIGIDLTESTDLFIEPIFRYAAFYTAEALRLFRLYSGGINLTLVQTIQNSAKRNKESKWY